jgi:hypothetical protein
MTQGRGAKASSPRVGGERYGEGLGEQGSAVAIRPTGPSPYLSPFRFATLGEGALAPRHSPERSRASGGVSTKRRVYPQTSP